MERVREREMGAELQMSENQDNSEAGKYISSLGDAVKKRFAIEYLKWLRAGQAGPAPARGTLAPALARAVCANLEALI